MAAKPRVTVDGREAAARAIALASGLSIEDARRAVAVGDATLQGVEFVGQLGGRLLSQLAGGRDQAKRLAQIEVGLDAAKMRATEVLSHGRRLEPGVIDAEVVEAEIVDDGRRTPPAPVTPRRFR